MSNLLDNIKGAMKFIKANFQFGEEVEELQKERLHICKTSGKGGQPCHNFELFSTPLGDTDHAAAMLQCKAANLIKTVADAGLHRR